MQVSGFAQVFLAGAFGGTLVELMRWWKLRESENLPIYAQSFVYWGLTVAMIIAGGILAVFYGTDARNALMVTNIGATAPALIGAFAAKSNTRSRVTRGPEVSPAGNGRVEHIRKFLTFT